MSFGLFCSIPLLLLLFAGPAFSQGEPDLNRSFGQGEILGVPGGTGYLGDFSYPIQLPPSSLSFDSILGTARRHSGWGFPPDPALGLRSVAPGLFFEDIAHPFHSALSSAWLPRVGPVELLDHSASGWWGPVAASGAIRLRAPLTTSEPRGFGAWGASGNTALLGARIRYQDPSFAGEAIRREWGEGREAYAWVQRVWHPISEDGGVGGSFLLAGNGSGDHWRCFAPAVRVGMGSFHTLELTPYYQEASLGGEDAVEWGGRLGYGLEMAGIVRLGLRGGFQRTRLGGLPTMDSGFFQATGEADLLGDWTADLAVRWDLFEDTPGNFGGMGSIHHSMGDLSLKAHAGVGEPIGGGPALWSAGAGILIHPTVHWNAWFGGFLEGSPAGEARGFRFAANLLGEGVLPSFLEGVDLRFSSKTFLEDGGVIRPDADGKLSLRLTSPYAEPAAVLWAGGRVLDRGSVRGETGAEVGWKGWILSLAWLLPGEGAGVWPDPLDPPGEDIRFVLGREF